MSHPFDALRPADIAQFYYRVAAQTEKNKGTLEKSLAAELLRHWLDNRNPADVYRFTAPSHLKNHSMVLEQLLYHRRVFLSQEPARLPAGSRIVGLLPRMQGRPGFPKWDGRSALELDYNSLVEFPLRYQLTGNNGDRDILYALRGFQLHSRIRAALEPMGGQQGPRRYQVRFEAWESWVSDRYDFNSAEYITLPNPDYGRAAPGAIEPQSTSIRVPHHYTQVLIDNGLACDYDLRSDAWHVDVASVRTSGVISVP